MVDIALGIASALMVLGAVIYADKRGYDRGFDAGEELGHEVGFEAGRQQGMSEIPEQIQRLLKQPELFAEWLEGEQKRG